MVLRTISCHFRINACVHYRLLQCQMQAQSSHEIHSLDILPQTQVGLFYDLPILEVRGESVRFVSYKGADS